MLTQVVEEKTEHALQLETRTPETRKPHLQINVPSASSEPTQRDLNIALHWGGTRCYMNLMQTDMRAGRVINPKYLTELFSISDAMRKDTPTIDDSLFDDYYYHMLDKVVDEEQHDTDAEKEENIETNDNIETSDINNGSFLDDSIQYDDDSECISGDEELNLLDFSSCSSYVSENEKNLDNNTTIDHMRAEHEEKMAALQEKYTQLERKVKENENEKLIERNEQSYGGESEAITKLLAKIEELENSREETIQTRLKEETEKREAEVREEADKLAKALQVAKNERKAATKARNAATKARNAAKKAKTELKDAKKEIVLLRNGTDTENAGNGNGENENGENGQGVLTDGPKVPEKNEDSVPIEGKAAIALVHRLNTGVDGDASFLVKVLGKRVAKNFVKFASYYYSHNANSPRDNNLLKKALPVVFDGILKMLKYAFGAQSVQSTANAAISLRLQEELNNCHINEITHFLEKNEKIIEKLISSSNSLLVIKNCATNNANGVFKFHKLCRMLQILHMLDDILVVNNKIIWPTLMVAENNCPQYTKKEKKSGTNLIVCLESIRTDIDSVEKLKSLLHHPTPTKSVFFLNHLVNSKNNEHRRLLWEHFSPGHATKSSIGSKATKAEKTKAKNKAKNETTWRKESLTITVSFFNWYYFMTNREHSIGFHQKSTTQMLSEIADLK